MIKFRRIYPTNRFYSAKTAFFSGLKCWEYSSRSIIQLFLNYSFSFSLRPIFINIFLPSWGRLLFNRMNNALVDISEVSSSWYSFEFSCSIALRAMTEEFSKGIFIDTIKATNLRAKLLTFYPSGKVTAVFLARF